MSKNCINCLVNDRTGGDLLCDTCRIAENASTHSMQTAEQWIEHWNKKFDDRFHKEDVSLQEIDAWRIEFIHEIQADAIRAEVESKAKLSPRPDDVEKSKQLLCEIFGGLPDDSISMGIEQLQKRLDELEKDGKRMNDLVLIRARVTYFTDREELLYSPALSSVMDLREAIDNDTKFHSAITAAVDKK